MNIKKVVKWLSIPLFTMIAIYVNQHNQEVFVGIIGGLGILGLYLMFNPTWIIKTTSVQENEYKNKFLKLFNDNKVDLEFKKRSLLKDFKTDYIIWCSVGSVVLFFIAISIVLLATIENRLIGFFSISFLITFFMMTEGDELRALPWSRYDRTRLIYFNFLLKSEKKFQELISRNELIKNDIGNLKKETSIDFTQIINNINIDRSKSSTYVNNDNRVLQNNFVTTIETRQNEDLKLNMESNFWKFIKLENSEQDVLMKYKKFIDIIYNLNLRFLKSDKKELFRFSDNKIHFNNSSHGKLFANFTKYLIFEKILDEEIFYTNNRKYLLDIFEVSGGTEFKHFQPVRWNNIDERNIIFYTKFK